MRRLGKERARIKGRISLALDFLYASQERASQKRLTSPLRAIQKEGHFPMIFCSGQEAPYAVPSELSSRAFAVCVLPIRLSLTSGGLRSSSGCFFRCLPR